MLEPHGRTLLFDILKPPEDHVLDFALATTFTLDLMALLTAPVAFSLFDVDDHRDLLNQDSLTLLESLRRYADKITVFCQAGQIGVPKAQFPQLEFLEQSVVQCQARLPTASFHPKIWLIRYIASDNRVTYRLACLTRNLTFDRCWDTAVTLEGALLDRQRAMAANHPIGDFVAHLPDRATQALSEDVRRRVAVMDTEVRRVEFQPPEGFDSVEFHSFGMSPARAFPFDDRPGRLFVISPFVSDGGLKRLTDGREGTVLVSRPESLENPNCTFPGIKRFYVLSNATQEESEAPASDGIDLTRGLHAKCYVIDAGWKTHIFTGSANATEAAFSNNVEFLVELVGAKSKVGIDSLFERGDGKTCLGDMLEEFKPVPKEIDEEEEGRRAAIERVRQALAGQTLKAQVTAVDDHFAVELKFSAPMQLEAGVSIATWPVTVGEGWSQPLGHDARSLTFPNLSFEALSAFYAFSVAVEGSNRAETFVLRADLVDAPADRRERLLRSFLKDRKRLLRFLMFLLADDAELADAMGHAVEKGNGADASEAAQSNGALLESLLRTLHRTPHRLDAVARLVEDVKRQPDCGELLPPDFDAVWASVWAARQARRQ
jgi:hypothetical protein